MNFLYQIKEKRHIIFQIIILFIIPLVGSYSFDDAIGAFNEYYEYLFCSVGLSGLLLLFPFEILSKLIGKWILFFIIPIKHLLVLFLINNTIKKEWLVYLLIFTLAVVNIFIGIFFMFVSQQ